MSHILVLGGGPDAERQVSLESSKSVAEALAAAGHKVEYRVIERPSAAELRNMPGEVIFPVLHGGWGEGGPLQDLLESLGRPYVGCRPAAARAAMDKIATKFVAATLGVPTAPCTILNTRDPGCPLDLPVVVKPTHEGSSVGVHICTTSVQWCAAHEAARLDMLAHPGRVYMAEKAVLNSTELTVGWLGEGIGPLAPIEIRPSVAFYDYEAKYTRDDTQYLVDPPLPTGLTAILQQRAAAMAEGLGVRHLCRVDFLLSRASDGTASAFLLEVNTMPGFTGHSLLPMAAKHRGMPMPQLCSKLVEMALHTATH